VSESQRLAVEEMLRASPDLDSLPPQELRIVYEPTGQLTPVDDSVRHESIMIGNVPAEIGCATGSDNSKTILYFHGGGYMIGSLQTHRGLVALLGQAAGVRTLAVDYRLAPEHPYPAASDDATQAYRWLLDGGAPPSSIVFAGDSAGGGLALATLLRARDEGLPLPAAAALFSPLTDLGCTGASMRDKMHEDVLVTENITRMMASAYLGNTDPKTPYASPLFGDLTGLPPTLIHVGSSEVLLDDSIRLLRALGIANVPTKLRLWAKLPHVWQLYSGLLDEGRESLTEAGLFLKDHLDS